MLPSSSAATATVAVATTNEGRADAVAPYELQAIATYQRHYDVYCSELERVLCHLENSINSTQEALIQLRTILNKQDGDDVITHRSWIIVDFFEDVLHNYKDELDTKRQIVARLRNCRDDINALRALNTLWEIQCSSANIEPTD